MKIKTLTLKNFKGITEGTINANGEDLTIYGDNGTGKTTIADSFSWLLFGKDSLNRKDFGIKPYDGQGDTLHNVNTEVECVFMEPDATLRRVYYEKYTKKRGQATEEFTGHTTDYFVDDVPCSEKEYKSRIDALIDEETFKLLTNPQYFNTVLKWEQRRAKLFEVCGTVSDDKVLASYDELGELRTLLGTKSVDDFKAIVKAKLTKINDELKFIPARIDEQQKCIDSVSVTDIKELRGGLEVFENRKKQLQEELSLLQNGGESAKLKLDLANVDADIQKVVNAFEQMKAKMRNEQYAKQTELSKQLSSKKVEKIEIEGTIEILEKSIERKEKEKEFLKDKYGKEYMQEPIVMIDSVCPVCKQNLPEEQVEKSREESIAYFNKSKSENLEQIQTQGKKLASEITAEKAKLEEFKLKLVSVSKDVQELEILKISIEEHKDGSTYENMPEYMVVMAKRTKLLEQLQTPDGSTDEKEKLKVSISETEAEINSIQTQIVTYNAYETSRKRVEELRADEKRLAGEYQEYQRRLFLIETFITKKCDLVSEQINSRFSLAKFKLFETQINGGIVECCEAVYNGVPYSDLNNAMRINIGLDIINTLSQHYSVNAPVFVDNAESVTALERVGSQIVRLVVDENYKTLDVCVSRASKQVA